MLGRRDMELLGVELTVNWYLRLIIRDFAILEDAASDVLPANRRICGDFIASGAVNFIDDILSGLDDGSMYDDVDWEHSFFFGRFKQYVLSEQRRMGKMLADLRFNIDQENTLTLVTGDGRPETVSTISRHKWWLVLYLLRAVHLAPGASLRAARHPDLPLGQSQRDP
jgi:hypothetical protein